MKILGVLGSPRRNGNTSTLIEEYLKGVEENNSDVEISKIFIEEKDIKACRGCLGCQSGKLVNCAIKDDMSEIYKVFEEAEIVVLSTPIYFFNMSTQLKTFMDRLFAAKAESWKGKKIVLLTTYGDSDEITSGAINLTNIIKQTVEYTGSEFIQNFGVSTQMDPNFVIENKELLNEVYEMGKSLLEELNVQTN